MIPNQYLENQQTPEATALSKRYSDAYRLANANERLGSTYQTLATFLGILAIVGAIVVVVTLESVPAAVGVGFIGLLFAAYLNGTGVQISAQGQLLKANIDSAINTSPFLSKDQKATIMALSSEARSEYTPMASLEADDSPEDSESYMRFFSTDTRPLTLSILETNLKQLSSDYTIDHVPTGSSETGFLKFGPDTLGEIEVSQRGRDNFEDDIKEFKQAVQGIQHPNTKVVIEVLNNVNTIIVVQLSSDAREVEGLQKKIEPLWEWLFSNSEGLLHVDDEGFYRETELILELE